MCDIETLLKFVPSTERFIDFPASDVVRRNLKVSNSLFNSLRHYYNMRSKKAIFWLHTHQRSHNSIAFKDQRSSYTMVQGALRNLERLGTVTNINRGNNVRFMYTCI